MPFVLIIAGAVLIVAATRNTQQELFYLLALDFTGQNNFVFWFLSILVIGAIGYIPKMKPISDGFLILVILVLFLRKGTGFFDMFNRQIAGTETATPRVSASGSSVQGASFIGGSSGISLGTPIGSVGIGFPLSGAGISGIPGAGESQCDFFDPYCELRRGDPFAGGFSLS